MNRRHLLATTATAIAVGVAGCGDSDNSNPDNTTNTTDDTNTTDPGNGGNPEQALDEAVSILAETATVLDETLNLGFDVTDTQLETLRTNIETATATLDEVAQADESFDGRLTAARDVLAVQEGLTTSRANARALNVDRQVSAATDSLNSAVSEAESPIEVDSSVIDGITQSLDPGPVPDEQLSLYDTLEDRLEELDAEPLNNQTLAYEGELSQYVRYDRNRITLHTTILEIYQEYFSTFGPLFDGLTAFDEERWSESLDLFTQARETIDSAIEMANSIDPSNTPDNSGPGFENLIGLFNSVRERVVRFVEAATTATEGDTATARSEFETLVEEISF